MSAARLVYIELEAEKPMYTKAALLGGKMVAKRTPCIVLGLNTREHTAWLQESQAELATRPKTDMAVYSTKEMDMVARANRNEFTRNDVYTLLVQPKKLIPHPPYKVVKYSW